MRTAADAAREFWQGVLAAGGMTTIPRWALHPVPGMAEHEAPIPGDLLAALRRLADELTVPLTSVVLAAHAKVLAALSSETEVATGYLAGAGGPPLPCRLTTEPDSWRALVLATHRVESQLLSHQEFPVDALRRELDLLGPSFETVFDPAGGGADLAPDMVLSVAVEGGDRPRLRLRYRTTVLHVGCVARIAGYHLTALGLMAADPGARHGRQSLLSAEEHRFQIEGLAGPRRQLPDRRVHELFEQRVAAHPGAVAAVHGRRQWTYRELNARANRLGRALLDRGLRREEVVAVVTERNLDWMAAVLAIFKAGGVYLPLEPHFPADRIATMLARAACRLVLTEPGSTTTLEKALDSVPGVRTLFVEDAYEEQPGGGNLGIDVAPDQLAYIYFTSGSTGEPKGAMCEHAGMINHLYAKIDDLAIGAGQVVAQTAPQCFDISLWQLVSALLAGGRTLVVEQDVILDVARFVDTIVDGRVAVLQVVPSYLEAVVSYLEQHRRPLPHLQCVSVTGEALKKELVQRWFAVEPGIKLVNAYGLTETSDDTNHEVMDGVPERERIPLGRSVNNVSVYVVDEHLSLVPLGAPGAIAFSGVCVGRGYVNDPERTRQAYTDDPHRPGQRLYRGGDYGRWLPDGKLEFLGRRDSQVKVRGFRIELGEVESAMLRVPGVADAAVVVVERAGGSKHLVGFYAGPRPVDADALRDRLAASLPGYMVPSVLHWLEALPLTANGKIDSRALTALAGGLDTVEDGYHPPITPAEQRVAAAWAKVLGIPQDQIGRSDHFFDRGGTSLAAVKLAVALGRVVSLENLTRHPILADMAALVDGAGAVPRSNGKEIRMSSSCLASPLDVELRPGTPPILRVEGVADGPGWVAGHRDALRALVAEHGSVLVRGLRASHPAEVGDVVRELAPGLMTEKETFAPRGAYSEGVYSSSKWPPNQPMCMHHELSYVLAPPGLMMFACLAAPAGGGATALADATAVLEALPTELTDRFEREGWLLTRNYNEGIGASLVEVFGTEDRGTVESYCRANAIEVEWLPDGGLRTHQRRPAVVRHPLTGRRCWFNQVAFFNEWTIAPEVREYLVDVFGPDGLPFNTRFGNGDPVGEDVVELINRVYEANTVREPWEAGDLMLVDNVRTAHGREPFEGRRTVVVAMAEPVRLHGRSIGRSIGR